MESNGDTDDAASEASASVASFQGFGVIASAEVVFAGVDDDGASNDAVRANEGDLFVLERGLDEPVCVRRGVAKVSNVSLLVRGRSVIVVERIEVRPRAQAAVRVVSKLVDVETMQAGSEASEVDFDTGRLTVAFLREAGGTGDSRVSVKDSNGFDGHLFVVDLLKKRTAWGRNEEQRKSRQEFCAPTSRVFLFPANRKAARDGYHRRSF